MKIIFLLLSFYSVQVFAKSNFEKELGCLGYLDNSSHYYKTALVSNKKSKNTFFLFHKDQVYSCTLDNTVNDKLLNNAYFYLKLDDMNHRASYVLKNDKLELDLRSSIQVKKEVKVDCKKTDKTEEAKSALLSHINDKFASYPVRRISSLSNEYSTLKAMKDSCESLNDGAYKEWIRQKFSKVYYEREKPKAPRLDMPNDHDNSGSVQ